MHSARDILTPASLAMLQAIADAGSFAAAARGLGLVPSALSYRVRQIEEALDVLLFDRNSRQARLTPSGAELLREGARILGDIESMANRVKRVATGWEPELTIAVDGIIARQTVMELCDSFLALAPPTRLRLRDETLAGTLAALHAGQADLAIGVVDPGSTADIHARLLGEVRFVFAVAPHHPLASAPEPLSDALVRQHRAVAVADSIQRGRGLTIGLLPGQDVFTVATMQAKLEAQLRGMGAGFLPECMARAYIDSGRLVVRRTERSQRLTRLHYAWRGKHSAQQARALHWWLAALEGPLTRQALLDPRARAGAPAKAG